MDEADFLDRYDPAAFARPSIAVDLVLMTIAGGAPAVLLLRRTDPPFRDRWALPGGFVGLDESLDDAARRVLAGKARLDDAWLEQLYTFGAVGRDPRMRIVSTAYSALLPPGRIEAAIRDRPDLTLARIDAPAAGPIGAHAADGEPLPLAFDHGDILATAMQRLRGKLDYTPIAFAFLPDLFTLRALQDVHEAIRGTPLNKPAFRRRMLDSGWIAPTGERETGTSFRPPELYRVRTPAGAAA